MNNDSPFNQIPDGKNVTDFKQKKPKQGIDIEIPIRTEANIDQGTAAIFEALVIRTNTCKEKLEQANDEFNHSQQVIRIYMAQVCEKLNIPIDEFTLLLDQRKFVRKPNGNQVS